MEYLQTHALGTNPYISTFKWPLDRPVTYRVSCSHMTRQPMDCHVRVLCTRSRPLQSQRVQMRQSPWRLMTKSWSAGLFCILHHVPYLLCLDYFHSIPGLFSFYTWSLFLLCLDSLSFYIRPLRLLYHVPFPSVFGFFSFNTLLPLVWTSRIDFFLPRSL